MGKGGRPGRPRLRISNQDRAVIDTVRARADEMTDVLEEFQHLREAQEALVRAHTAIEKAINARQRRRGSKISLELMLPDDLLQMSRDALLTLPEHIQEMAMARLPSPDTPETKLREARLLIEITQGCVFLDFTVAALTSDVPWPSEDTQSILIRLLREQGFKEQQIALALTPDAIERDATESHRKRAARRRKAEVSAIASSDELRTQAEDFCARLETQIAALESDDPRAAELRTTLDSLQHYARAHERRVRLQEEPARLKKDEPRAAELRALIKKFDRETNLALRLNLLVMPMMPGIVALMDFRTPAWPRTSPKPKPG